MSNNRSNNLPERGADVPNSSDPRDVDSFIQALEADDANADSLSTDDRDFFRLGTAIRQSAQQDLPEPNESLRKELIAKLDHDLSSDVQTKPDSKLSDRSFSPFALAACLLLSLGLIAIVVVLNQAERATDSRSAQNIESDVDLDGIVDAKDGNSDNLNSSVDAPTRYFQYLAEDETGDLEIEGDDQTVLRGHSIDSDALAIEDLLRRVNPSGTAEITIRQIESANESKAIHSLQANTAGVEVNGRFGLAGQPVPVLAAELGDAFDAATSGEMPIQASQNLGYVAGDFAVEQALKNGAHGGLKIESQEGGQLVEFLGGQVEEQSMMPRITGERGGGGGGMGGGGIGGLGGEGRLPDGRQFRYEYGERSGDSRAGSETADSLTRGFGRRSGRGGINSEQYDPIVENEFRPVEGSNALSTFSIDVDTASYANMRRFLLDGQRPPRNSIRIEELVNYFNYDYPQPTGDDPFAVDMEIASCPWNDRHHLLRVALKGKDVHRDERSPSNLVFLLDVSGSMQSADKLPLLKQGLTMMVQQLSENDSVSIVTYAGNAGVVLNPTKGVNKRQIEMAIERLSAGGSTNGSAGIEMAYQLAQQQFIETGSNRVILATDGDLNVGVTDDNALVQLISQKAGEGVFLTVLGFGTGNLKDSKLEKLADNGNGMYAYIDSAREAHKVLIEQMSGSLDTIAKDVKLQIEFNPAEVSDYRLIGYENRVLAAQDFDNDRKDAGEIGAGHCVTALYELVLKGNSQNVNTTQRPLKYQTSEPDEPSVKNMNRDRDPKFTGELLTLALRYKKPDAQQSERIEFTLDDEPKSFSSASNEFRFAASVASFGMILRESSYRGQTSLKWVEDTASRALGNDAGGYRSEFLGLVRKASTVR